MQREEPSGETPGPPPFCLGHAWGDWKVPAAGVCTGGRRVRLLPALMSLSPLPPIRWGDLTFRPSAPTRPRPPCWGDSPQGRVGSLAEECIPSPSKGRCKPREVCGVLEHARAPTHPELLIRTKRAKLVRAMRRERPAGVGKVCGVLPGNSSLITRTGALPSQRGSHTAPRL